MRFCGCPGRGFCREEQKPGDLPTSRLVFCLSRSLAPSPLPSPSPSLPIFLPACCV